MQSELTQLITIAIGISPITGAIVQGMKAAGWVDKKLNIVAAVLIGMALAGAWALTFHHADLVAVYLMAGMLSGLSAAGLYDLTKGTLKKKEESK